MHKDPRRREFLGTLAAFSLFPLEEEKPDLILHNANIYTVNAKEPRAQAIALCVPKQKSAWARCTALTRPTRKI
jgi:hypothetical protein